MPFISTKTNVPVSEKQTVSLKTRLGKAIELLPGKSESWLMLSFEGSIPMYFQGKADPAAMVEVNCYGRIDAAAADRMTAAVTDIVSDELSIPAGRIYVKYEETGLWGWNGSNF